MSACLYVRTHVCTEPASRLHARTHTAPRLRGDEVGLQSKLLEPPRLARVRWKREQRGSKDLLFSSSSLPSSASFSSCVFSSSSSLVFFVLPLTSSQEACYETSNNIQVADASRRHKKLPRRNQDNPKRLQESPKIAQESVKMVHESLKRILDDSSKMA